MLTIKLLYMIRFANQSDLLSYFFYSILFHKHFHQSPIEVFNVEPALMHRALFLSG